MTRNEPGDSLLLPLVLAVTSMLLATLALLLVQGDASGWEWIIVLGLVAAFVVFAVLLPLAGRPALRRSQRPRGLALAQAGLGLALFLWFVWRFPHSIRTGSEAAVLADWAAGLAGSALVFRVLYPRR